MAELELIWPRHVVSFLFTGLSQFIHFTLREPSETVNLASGPSTSPKQPHLSPLFAFQPLHPWAPSASLWAFVAATATLVRSAVEVPAPTAWSPSPRQLRILLAPLPPATANIVPRHRCAMGDANTAVHSHARQPSPQSDLSTLSNLTGMTGPEAVSSIDASLAPSSTPDTSQADTSSVHSDAPKATDQSAIQRRQSSRTRAVVATYNDKELAGTRLHTPRKYLKGLAASAKLQSPAGPQSPATTAAHDNASQVDNDPAENNAVENGVVEIEAVEVTVVDNVEQEELAESAPQSEEPEQAAMRRASGRRRSTVVTYNDKENAGTRIHTPTKYIDGTYIRKSLGDEPSGQPPLAGAPRRSSTSIRPQSSLRKSITADQLEQDAVELLGEKSPASGPRKLKRVADRVTKPSRSKSSTPSKRKLINGYAKAHDTDSDDTIPSKRGLKYSTKKSPTKRALTTKRSVKRQRIVELSPETDLEPARITEIKTGPLRKPWLSAGKFYNTGQDDLVGRLSAVIGHKPKKTADVDHEQGQNPYFPMPMFSMAEKLDLYPKKKLPEHKRPFEPFQLPFEVFSPLPKEVKVKDWRDLKRSKLVFSANLTY